MKPIVSGLIFVLFLLVGCGSDDSEADVGNEPSFSFRIVEAGQEPRFFEGTSVRFTSTFTDTKDFEGNNTELNTIAIIAQDPVSFENVTIIITMENQVTTDTHEIGSDIINFYNAVLNYSRDVNVNLIDYQSDAGSIRLSSISPSIVAGSVSVQASGADGSMSIEGTFTASSQ